MTLLQFDWLKGQQLAAVLAALDKAGGEVRVVGGAVRDALLGRPIGDIDLATTLRPEQVVTALDQAGLKAVPTGLAHGTVTAVSDGVPFEITTLRRDVQTDGRHAVVAYTTDWQEDAARRDFTINAMSLSLAGKLFDYFDGQKDLTAGVVRFVGDPATRIREDVLRILRFFRFHAQCGQGSPDATGMAACLELAPLLKNLSAERVRNELLKLLATPNPLISWRPMVEGGVLAALDLPLANLSALESLVALEAPLGRVDALRRLAAVAAVGVHPDFLAQCLRLSNAQFNRLDKMMTALSLPADYKAYTQFAYRHGAEALIDRLFLSGLITEALLQKFSAWQPPAFPLSGGDVLALGAEGEEVGRILNAVENSWLNSNFALTKDECLALARQAQGGA